MTTHQGSCHCGAVSFTFNGEIERAMTCNCSYCRRAGHMLVFGPESAFTLNAKPEALGLYHFNKNVIDHNFCKVCGITTHGGGVGPDGVRMAAVNVRCIPGVDLDALAIDKVDGASF